MTSKRDWLLQQMGISQYHLRRPKVLQGEIAIRIADTTRLLIVAHEEVSLASIFLDDVLRSLNFSRQQLQIIHPDQLCLLPENINCVVWFMGIAADKCYTSHLLETASWSELVSSGQAKRNLWQQMCNYDSDLLPQAR